MDNTVLYFGLWKHRLNGRRKPGQIVRTGNEIVLYASISHAIDYRCPEFGALVLAYPVNADGDVHRFIYDLPFAADMSRNTTA